MKKIIKATVIYLALVAMFWGIGYLLTGTYEGSKDFAIGSITYSVLFRLIILSFKDSNATD